MGKVVTFLSYYVLELGKSFVRVDNLKKKYLNVIP